MSCSRGRAASTSGSGRTFELTPMAIAALEQLLQWEVPHVAELLGKRTAQMAERAEDLGLRPLPPAQRGPHMLGIELPQRLRSPLLAHLAQDGCHAAIRGAALRLAPHLHVNDADVDRLSAALAAATTGA